MPQTKSGIAASAPIPPVLDFPLVRMRIKAGSLGLSLPGYAGGILRGGFGLALRRVSEMAWAKFFSTTENDRLFTPYMLVPPVCGRKQFAPGDSFEFELRLFGDAIEYISSCRTALALLGEMGLGRERGRYVLLAASYPDPGRQPATWLPPDAPVATSTAADWFAINGQSADEVVLELLTPLRLKHADHLVGATPDFSIVWSRLHARASLAAGCPLLSYPQKRELDERARAIVSVAGDEVRWQDWSRYSARQRQIMKFGGLTGILRYRGDLTPFLPWLSLGEAIGIGGKTTFGLGAYRLAIQ